MPLSDSLTDRPAWATLRGLLEAEGFRPSKSLGQNFLVDSNMARAIARDAQVKQGEHVLEVGPGCASLSIELAALGVDLTCVEIDSRLARIAHKLLEPYPNVRILETDVLGKKSSLSEPVTEALDAWGEEPWHLAANLPYAVSGPVMVVLARRPVPPRSITVLVQREVAERIASEPGTRQHGPLGLKLAPLYRANLVRSVPAGLFWPQPRVESSVLRLERRSEDPGSLAAYDVLVEGLFQRRRKTLRAALGAHLNDPGRALAALEQTGLDPVARAETLSWRSLRELERAIGSA